MNNFGILDPDGINDNPLTGKPYSDTYKKLGKIWSKFPAYEKATEIIKDIINHQVILIVSGTGSGKTVLLPKYTLHAFDYKGKIAITLPKQIIAKSAAEFSAKTLDVNLGEHVGYQYKGSPRNAKSNNTNLLYATDGTIVARLLNDPYLKDFDAVIIDEAHERKVQIDFLLYLLRNALKLRPELKVIIMSATINAKIFKNYFNKFKFKEINIGGKTNYPIESIFLNKSIKYKDVINEGFKIILKIFEGNKSDKSSLSQDVLFFITSSNEAFELCKKLDEYIKKNNKDASTNIIEKGNIFCVEVYAGMDAKKQQLAQDKILYKENTDYKRKLVVSTNVAESSLTIDGIKYVVDSGYELSGSYDPILRAKRLDRQMITHAQAKQRMGRAGRTEPGICYHLYTKQDFEINMKRFPEPDIRVSDISGECLKLLNLDTVQNTNELSKILNNFIEPPEQKYIYSAIDTLTQIGTIENKKISKIGKLVADLRGSDLKMSLAMILGKVYRCYHDIIKIISLLDSCRNNLSDIFLMPKNILKNNDKLVNDKKRFNDALNNLSKKFNKIQSKFKHKNSDHLSLLKIYNKYIELLEKNKNNSNLHEKLNQWGYDNFIKIKTFEKARKYVKKNELQLKKLIGKSYGEKLANELEMPFRNDIYNLDIDNRILSCLLISLRTNTATLTSNKKNYKTQYAKNIKIKINENSFTMLGKNILPKHVFYNELFISMNNPSLNIVSSIPKNIINLLAT